MPFCVKNNLGKLNFATNRTLRHSVVVLFSYVLKIPHVKIQNIFGTSKCSKYPSVPLEYMEFTLT